MKRNGRREMTTMFLVLLVPAVVLSVFPFASVGFKASTASSSLPARAAFVVLTEEQEKAALASARTSWQGDSGVRRLRADLSVGELPETDLKPVLDVRERPSHVSILPVAYPAGPFVPSAAAGRPKRIGVTKGEPRPVAFSREDLLKID